MPPDAFKDAVDNLRSSDSLRYDEGYHMLQGEFLTRHLDAVIELASKETDTVVRGRFIELLGDSHEPRVIPVLAEELRSPHADVRRWTLHALDCLDTPEACQLAAEHRSQHPRDSQ
jgi:HEAT repeat protein